MFVETDRNFIDICLFIFSFLSSSKIISDAPRTNVMVIFVITHHNSVCWVHF